LSLERVASGQAKGINAVLARRFYRRLNRFKGQALA
jgi:hypothetical protein